MKQAANTRKKLRDSKNIDVIDRLEKMLNSPEAEGLVWHKTCYAHFMDKSKLERLQSLKLRQRILNLKQACCRYWWQTFTANEMQPEDWNLCILCQTVVPKARLLIPVMMKQMSDQTIQASSLDYIIDLRLARVIDLIEAEGKYHDLPKIIHEI